MNFVKSHVWLYLAICFLVSLTAAAQVAVSTTQLNFGSVHVGTAATQAVTFTNNGTAPVFFIASFNPGSLGGSGDFSYHSDCPAQTPLNSGLPVGSSCSYQVSLTPSQAGAENNTLSITAFVNAANAQSFTIDLTGSGVAFLVAVYPASLNFGSVTYGQSSSAQTIKITNNDTVSLYFSAPVFTGDFASPAGSSGCGSGGLTLLSPGQNCSVSIAFTPYAIAGETGSVSVNAYSTAPQQLLGPVAAILSGAGHPLSVPASVSFGFEQIGTTVTVPTVISNSSPVAVNIDTITLGGVDFTQTNNCIGALAPGTQCVINVSYFPKSTATSTGSITLVDADATSPQTIQLTGAGTSKKLTVAPANAHGLKNSSTQFSAFQNGELSDGPITWSSSNPAVATISSSGEAALLSAGTTAITAVHGGQSGSTVLVVTLAAKPVFTAQPTDTGVSAVINGSGGVKVQLADNLGGPLAGQDILLSIGSNPPGKGTLSGTLNQITDATGTATFPDLKIDWLGSGYTLIAVANPISGAVAGTSAAFTELRVGDPCLGPIPACSSGCADSDGDGLNDAWEIAGGVDLNGDGLIADAKHDLLLPGADPNKPDIYVWYDWMDYGLQDWSCNQDSQCTGLGGGHRGETCQVGQCAYACSTDSECTSRLPAGAHIGERCISNMCQHTHDPLVLEPKTFQIVVDNFAAHGINLHILRGNAQPHSHVISYRPLKAMDDSCEGGSLASGTAGLGKYAESLYDIKPRSIPDKLNIAYHYAFYGHYVGCDRAEHCTPQSSGGTSDCPFSTNPDGTPKNIPAQGMTGLAEIAGNDFVVSLGGAINDQAFLPHLPLPSTFMHELGHNLGLRHDGHVDQQCTNDGGCSPGDTCVDLRDGEGQVCHQITGGMTGVEQPNFKPNFISVMNYRYEPNGIMFADSVGSSSPKQCQADSDCGGGPGVMCSNPPSGFCVRVDYSRQTLPTGGNTPGMLVENNLNEPAGLGSGTADLFNFKKGTCAGSWHIAASDGPVDWSGSGLLTLTNVQADVDAKVGIGNCDAAPSDVLSGHTEWPELCGIPFQYNFQCRSTGGPGGDGPSPEVFATELGSQMEIDLHLAYPLRPVEFVIPPDAHCSSKAVAPGELGTVKVALLGAVDFDVQEVEPSSLSFHGAKPISTTIKDFNGDGYPDLLLEFRNIEVRLSKQTTRVRLTGSLKSSQDFLGEVEVAAACPGSR